MIFIIFLSFILKLNIVFAMKYCVQFQVEVKNLVWNEQTVENTKFAGPN